ncbi:unnamed protein product [Rotaria sordida]|uniref:FAD-binding PCMH-type domain-containing protein n=1 Tax=Rotaria sordida TaxID=392033 RepID=A0A814NXG7_9BILA|nr:unnamed protein product [Rotaria sordida]CAF1097205.1 unnamed protein product [Rotaria sordida]CAF3598245.1 unnamed protein product [Rotaria sordida]CAF3945851.1 unnamed protein product [Rotaria sordida]
MIFTTVSYRAKFKLARTNNDDLQTCLSSSLPLSIRTIYPCSTLANQNSSQYQCDHFNVSGLSSVRGGRISHFPAVIVYATDSNNVQNVVKCATKLNYIVNARSGGHSYEGYCLGSMYNNIVINMEAINYTHINQYDGTGTFGAGARIGPIYYRTYQYNYTINAGSCPWVGLAGHALGGGQGFLGRLHGLLSDNILEMKAVNAQGQIFLVGELITINETHEPELYWALRGAGGGLFVIVTEFKIRLVKPPSLVRHFSSIWYLNATKLVMQRYQSLLFDDKISNFSNNLVLVMGVSKINVTISIFYFGIEFDEFNKTISLLLTTLPIPNRTDLYEQDWLTFVYKTSGIDDDSDDLQRLLLDNLTYPTHYFKAKHLFYDRPISSHSLDKFIDGLASGDGQIIMIFIPWDGYLSTIPVDETAFPHRHYKFSIQFTVYPNDEQHEKQQMNWLNQRCTELDECLLSYTSTTIN